MTRARPANTQPAASLLRGLTVSKDEPSWDFVCDGRRGPMLEESLRRIERRPTMQEQQTHTVLLALLERLAAGELADVNIAAGFALEELDQI